MTREQKSEDAVGIGIVQGWYSGFPNTRPLYGGTRSLMKGGEGEVKGGEE